MPVRVLGVGRLAGRAYGDERESAGGKVEEGVRRLAEDAQASGQQSDDQLGQDQRHPDGHGAQSDELRALLESLHGFTLSADFAAARWVYLSSDAVAKS